MRKIIVALAFFVIPTIANAEGKALVCLFKPSGERFNLVSMNGKDYIQWGSGDFEAVVANYREPYLEVTQYGYKGTFRMIYDAPKGLGYGGVKGFDGKGVEGEILCAAE